MFLLPNLTYHANTLNRHMGSRPIKINSLCLPKHGIVILDINAAIMGVATAE